MPGGMIELAWAAGFWDGEGCTYMAKNVPRMGTGQTDPEVLHRLSDALGDGTTYGPYPGRKPNDQPFWRWELTGFERVTAAIDLLRPYLSSIKILQADRALALHEVKLIGPKGHPKRCEIVRRYHSGETPTALAAEYGSIGSASTGW